MSIRFLTLRLKKEIVILFYLILLISIKSQFVSNKRQKGNRSRLGEDQGRKENSRGGESTLSPRLGISIGSLPLGFRGFCKGGHRKLWDPVGMEDIEETVCSRNKVLKHMGTCRDYGSLHRACIAPNQMGYDHICVFLVLFLYLSVWLVLFFFSPFGLLVFWRMRDRKKGQSSIWGAVVKIWEEMREEKSWLDDSI